VLIIFSPQSHIWSAKLSDHSVLMYKQLIRSILNMKQIPSLLDCSGYQQLSIGLSRWFYFILCWLLIYRFKPISITEIINRISIFALSKQEVTTNEDPAEKSRQNWVVVIQIICPEKPKIFTPWPFTEKKSLPTPVGSLCLLV